MTTRVEKFSSQTPTPPPRGETRRRERKLASPIGCNRTFSSFQEVGFAGTIRVPVDALTGLPIQKRSRLPRWSAYGVYGLGFEIDRREAYWWFKYYGTTDRQQVFFFREKRSNKRRHKTNAHKENQKPKEPENEEGKGNAHSNFVRLRTCTPALREIF